MHPLKLTLVCIYMNTWSRYCTWCGSLWNSDTGHRPFARLHSFLSCSFIYLSVYLYLFSSIYLFIYLYNLRVRFTFTYSTYMVSCIQRETHSAAVWWAYHQVPENPWLRRCRGGHTAPGCGFIYKDTCVFPSGRGTVTACGAGNVDVIAASHGHRIQTTPGRGHRRCLCSILTREWMKEVVWDVM